MACRAVQKLCTFRKWAVLYGNEVKEVPLWKAFSLCFLVLASQALLAIAACQRDCSPEASNFACHRWRLPGVVLKSICVRVASKLKSPPYFVLEVG